jgi:peptidoglycan/LPS O-acetylase OafA/YrhL
VATLLVVGGHAGLLGTGHAGDAGVTVFFVLSGYLITGVLLHRETLGVFYLRRAARLLPALALLVAVLALYAVAIGATRDYWSKAWPALSYVANWAQLSGRDMGVLSHTWSLAVEEQFYLLWPAFVLLVARRWLPATIGVVLVVSVALRIAFAVDGQPWRAYDGTDTNAYALAAGALLAVVAVPLARAWVAPVGALTVAAAALWPGNGAASDWSGGSVVTVPLLATAGGALLVWAAASGDARPLRSAVLRHAGEVSYGWYLWHYPIIGLTVGLSNPGVVGGAVAGLTALLLAELSWRFVEQPVRRAVHARTDQPRQAALSMPS